MRGVTMESLPRDPSISLSGLRRVHTACKRFEAAWNSGEPPQIGHYLESASEETPQAARELLVELAKIDLEYRWRRFQPEPEPAGEPAPASDRTEPTSTPMLQIPVRPRCEDYLAAHPQLAPLDGLPTGLIAHEYHVRRRWGDRPDRAEYRHRFPGLAEELECSLDQVDRALEADTAVSRDDSSLPTPDSPSQTASNVRCPHCRHSLDVRDDQPLSEITCTSCGLTFSLVGQSGAASGPVTNPLTGAPVLARFQFIELLGRGAFGAVWKARDTQLDRIVAIKVPRPGQFDGDAREQFLREARAAAQFQHPYVVCVHEIQDQGDWFYIVSDFVDGVTLDKWAAQQRPSYRDSAELCAKIADALQHAHTHGVVHRDLKPTNIIIDRQGEPHLMDFGLSKREAGEITMTVEGQILGTPAYMSPEQAAGKSHTVDRRADIYSLGVILFELLTGERPFRGNTQMVLKQVVEEEPPSPRRLDNRIPRDLEIICLKCLEKRPQRRFISAATVEAELSRFLRREPIRTRPTTRLTRCWRWCQRNPTTAFLSGLASILLLLTAVIGTWGYLSTVNALRLWETESQRAERAREEAEQRRVETQTERDRVRHAELALKEQSRLAGEYSDDLAQVRETLAQRVRELEDSRTAEIQARNTAEELRQAADQANQEAQQESQAATKARLDARKAQEAATKAQEAATRAREEAARTREETWTAHEEVDRQRRRADEQMNLAKQAKQAQEELQRQRERVQQLEQEAARLQQTGNKTEEDLNRMRGVAQAAVLQLTQARDLADQHRKQAYQALETLAQQRKQSEVFAPAAQLATYNNQLARVQHLWQCWPADALGLLDDRERCPVALRDFTWRLFRRAAQRDQLTLRGHRDAIHSVSFSPNGKQLASAGSDRSVRLWDVASEQELRCLLGHEGPVFAVAFNADGSLLASAGWGKYDGIGVADAPDDASTVRVPADGDVRIWEAHTGKPQRILRGPVGAIHAVAFSPDGRLVAAGSSGPFSVEGAICQSENGELVIWDVATGREQARMRHPQGINAVAFSPDGKTVAAAGGGNQTDGAAIRLWSPATGKLLRVLKEDVPLSRPVFDLAFSPDGGNLAAATSMTILSGEPIPGRLRPDDLEQGGMWDLQSGGLAWLLPGERVAPFHAVRFSPDGKNVALAGPNGTICVWDWQSREERLRLAADAHPVSSLAFSPDRRLLASASGSGRYKALDLLRRSGSVPARPGEIKLWRLEPSALGTSVLSLRDAVLSLAVSWDAKLVALAGRDEIIVWDKSTKQIIARIAAERPSKLACLAFARDNSTLAAAGSDGAVHLYDPRTGKALGSLPTHPQWITALAFSADSQWLAVPNRGAIEFWDFRSARRGRVLDAGLQIVRGLVFADEGRILLSADPAGHVKSWNLQTGRSETVVSPTTGEHLVSESCLSPNQAMLCVCHESHFETWDLRARVRRARFEGPKQQTLCMVFAPDGKTLASGGWDKKIWLWDPQIGQQRAVLDAHAAAISSLAFAPDGSFLVSGDRDGKASLWEAAGPHPSDSDSLRHGPPEQ